MVKQKDFQKGPQMQLLNQKSDQQQLSAVRSRKKFTNYYQDSLCGVHMHVNVYLCTIATGGAPKGLESGAPNALSNMS